MASEPIDIATLRRVAALARLSLDPARIPALLEELREIVSFMETLDELELEPRLPPVAGGTPLRPDEVRPSLGLAEVLEPAGERRGPRVQVPGVFAGEEQR
jgi:aspartyl-tRNA(Asn)/glutamyl-tRNA(Gln) amidotransferase subunit C